MYYDHDAFDRVSLAMREPYAPGPEAEAIVIPELIDRLADLIASRMTEGPARLQAAPTGGMQRPCSSTSSTSFARRVSRPA
jgi:hypothetical protein